MKQQCKALWYASCIIQNIALTIVGTNIRKYSCIAAGIFLGDIARVRGLLFTLAIQCKIVSKEEGRKHPKPGQITFTATNEPNRLIAASIGLARPVDDTQYGYLSEHHSTGETAQKAGDYAEDMAIEMLATVMGLPDDPTLAWDQREEQWRLSGKIYKTQNFTQSAQGHKDGLWTTVISAAVLIL